MGAEYVGEVYNRLADIDRDDVRSRIALAEVDCLVGDFPSQRCARPRSNILDVGKALGAQQVVRDVLRGVAEDRDLFRQPHGGRFEAPPAGQQLRGANEAGAGERQAG